MTPTQSTARALIFGMHAFHATDVAAIDAASFDRPWSAERWGKHLRDGNDFGLVVTRGGGPIIGFVVLRPLPKRIEILRLAVAPAYRRQGIGRWIVEAIKGNLEPTRFPKLRVVVPESNMVGQLFLRAVGFRAVLTMHGEDGDEIAFRFDRS